MSISMRKLKTLYKRDFIDYLKTPAIAVCSLLPILFIMFYKYIGVPEAEGDTSAFLLTFGMMLNSTMCAIMIPSTTIAEEKEKFTLRTLMLSNVNAMEFFLSKILMTTTVTFLGNLIVFCLANADASKLPAYIISTLLGNSCVIMLSAVIGMISRDQMSCSVIQIPVMLLFLVPPMFAGASKVLEMLTKIIPYGAMLQLFHQLTGPMKTGKIAGACGVLAVWLVVSVVLFAYFYKKKGTDN